MSSETVQNRRKVIIDTDVGLDDAQALLLALADPNIDILGITCVGGNTTLQNVCRNALMILTLTNRLEVPVFRGCKAPIIGNKKYGIAYHGSDGLGDCDPQLLPQIQLSSIQSEHACNALLRLAKEFPGEVSMVCLAPLTNLALAVKLDPDFTKNLKHVYIMGGNHAGEGNETPAAEFNFHHDPEAASIVLSNADCSVTMMGWEVCSQLSSRFDVNWILNFYNQDSPQSRFLKTTHRNVLAMLQQNLEQDPEETQKHGQVMCDEWIMAIFLDDGISTLSQTWPTVVELAGRHTRGQCVVDKRFYCNRSEGKNNVSHVLALDIDRMKERLMKMAQAASLPIRPTNRR